MDLAKNEKLARKLRKKLRQIEILERLPRHLTDEEHKKIESACETRKELLSVIQLIENAKPQTNSEYGDETTKDEEENPEDQVEHSSTLQINDEPSYCTNEETAQNGIHEEMNGVSSPFEGDVSSTSDYLTNKDNISSPARKTIKLSDPSLHDNSATDVTPPSYSEAVKRKKATKQNNPAKSKPSYYKRYGVEYLEDHDDIIFDVSIADGLLASASRDNLVKVWNLEEDNALLCTLGGHAEAVNTVEFIPRNQSQSWCQKFGLTNDSLLLLSGGQDSCVRVWSVSEQPTELLNVYTFTPINRMVAVDATEGLFLLGTSSGKLELWNLMTKRQMNVETCFTSGVSDLKIYGKSPRYIGACSEQGEVCVFDCSCVPLSDENETNDSTCYQLNLLYKNETGINRVGSSNDQVHLRNARSLAFLNEDTIIIADSGINIKILSWKSKLIEKVSNCPGEYSVTDAVHLITSSDSALVYTSGLNLETECGTVNLFKSVTDGKIGASLQHLGSLRLTDFGRILCISSVILPNGTFLLITGGSHLAVWQPLNSTITKRFDPINIANLTKARQSHVVDYLSTEEEEDEDEEAEENDSDYEAGHQDENQDTDSEPDQPDEMIETRSNWRCSIL